MQHIVMWVVFNMLCYIMLYSSCNMRSDHWALVPTREPEKKKLVCVCLAMAFHISGTALLKRLLAISSSFDDITTKPFRAFTISPRLWEMTASSLLYLKDKSTNDLTGQYLIQYYSVIHVANTRTGASLMFINLIRTNT